MAERKTGLADEPEIKIAAAAVAAAVSPPLGLAVAAGAVLRSARVRAALRQGTVQALAGAMDAGGRLGESAARAAKDRAAQTEGPQGQGDPGSAALPAKP